MSTPTTINFRACFAAAAAASDLDADLAPWVDPSKLSFAQRATLKRRIEAGEVQAIRTWITAFGDEPNSNGIRPKPGRLSEFSASSRDVPFQRGHWRSTSSILGVIFDRRVRTDERDVEVLDLAHEITDPEAMIDFLDRKMIDFSISMRLEDVRCSECEEPVVIKESWWSSYYDFSCNCKGNEMFGFGPMELIHNAWVSEGAYRHTGVAPEFSAEQLEQLPPDLREKLIAYATEHGHAPPKEKTTMPTKEGTPTVAELLAQLEAEKTARLAAETKAETAELAATKSAEKVKAAEDAQFEAAFETAVKERRVLPARKAHFETLYKGDENRSGMGLDFALESLGALEPDPRFAGEPVGFDTKETGVAPPEDDGAAQYSLAAFRVSEGTSSQAALEQLRTKGFGVLH